MYSRYDVCAEIPIFCVAMQVLVNLTPLFATTWFQQHYNLEFFRHYACRRFISTTCPKWFSIVRELYRTQTSRISRKKNGTVTNSHYHQALQRDKSVDFTIRYQNQVSYHPPSWYCFCNSYWYFVTYWSRCHSRINILNSSCTYLSANFYTCIHIFFFLRRIKVHLALIYFQIGFPSPLRCTPVCYVGPLIENLHIMHILEHRSYKLSKSYRSNHSNWIYYKKKRA